MRRFIYAPEVQVYIRSEEAGKTFDVSKDIISGSVTRRLDAVSNASIVLQNKFALYTRKFKPMDRIAIFMTRIGDPMLVFSGYVDEAPFYQMFPAPVTINASCTLKLLQNTYFDPGLPFMTQWFMKFGWVYDPSSGSITAPFGGFGNYDQPGTDKKFRDGNLTRLIAAALHEIAGWPLDHIFIRSIPGEFKTTMQYLMKEEALEYKEDYQHLVATMSAILGISGSDPAGGDTTASSFSGGNASPVVLAKMAKQAGFRGEALVTAVAVALAESSGRSNAMNYNTDGSYDVGCWQINTVHTSGGRGLASPPHGVGTLHMPGDYEQVKAALPAGVRGFMDQCQNPIFNAAQAFSIAGHGRSFTPWSTYNNGAYRSHMTEARRAVEALSKDQRGTGDLLGLQTGTEWSDTSQKDQSKTTKKLGNCVLGPGADRPGAKTKAKVIQFGKVIAGVAGGTVVIGTGTNHNEFVVGTTRQSDHWTGDAMDIVSVGGVSLNGSPGHINPALTRAGQAALVATGQFTRSQASQIQGGLHNVQYSNGCRIQIIFNTMEGGNHYNHLHVGVSGNLPADLSKGMVQVQGGAQTETGQAVQDVTKTAREAAWFQLQLPSVDSITSVALSGKRALANDIPLFEWIEQMCKAGGRRFTSMPNGDFLAFFPDYFNDFGRTPYFIIRPIEIIDLTIQVTDRELVTHVFATGTSYTPQINLQDRMLSMVASVQEPAFNMFINTDEAKKKTAKQRQGKKKSKKKTTNKLHVWKGAEAFLKRYGARPLAVDLPDLRNPVLLWMAAWMEFQKQWSKQFGANASFTFMPELLPGGIVNFDNKITMFVESVTHNFDMEAGFTTSAELTSPAAANPKDKRFGGMVLAGGNFGVAASIKEDKDIQKNAGPPGPIRPDPVDFARGD